MATKDDEMAEKMKNGKAKGGHARAAALSPLERQAIATKAAKTRWAGSRELKATHKGNFKEEFGLDVDCFVLDDEQKSAVISQRGMGEALGLSRQGGARLPYFLRGRQIAPYVGRELTEKLRNPLKFQWAAPVANPLPVTVH